MQFRTDKNYDLSKLNFKISTNLEKKMKNILHYRFSFFKNFTTLSVHN